MFLHMERNYHPVARVLLGSFLPLPIMASYVGIASNSEFRTRETNLLKLMVSFLFSAKMTEHLNLYELHRWERHFCVNT